VVPKEVLVDLESRTSPADMFHGLADDVGDGRMELFLAVDVLAETD